MKEFLASARDNMEAWIFVFTLFFIGVIVGSVIGYFMGRSDKRDRYFRVVTTVDLSGVQTTKYEEITKEQSQSGGGSSIVTGMAIGNALR